MAVTIVLGQNSGRNDSTGSLTSQALTFFATPTVGNVMCATIAADKTASPITVPGGWAVIDSQLAGALGIVETYRRVVQAGDGKTYTWTFTAAASFALNMYECTGADTTTPVDVHGKATNATGITQVSVTTTQPNELVFSAGFASWDTSITILTDTGFANDQGTTTTLDGYSCDRANQAVAGALSTNYASTGTNNATDSAVASFALLAKVVSAAKMQHSQGSW